MRSSSPSLAEAFGRGASAQGADVVAAGSFYRPALLRQRQPRHPRAMITASHNPSKYNGIKLCRAGPAGGADSA